MTANFIRELFDYHQKANQLYIDKLFPRVQDIPEYAYKMLSHNLFAQHIWNCRILQKPALWKNDHIFDEVDIELIIQENQKNLNTILENKSLNELITYNNIKGESYTSVLSDIFMHVSHHYSYHRGQIAYTLRNAGFDPPPTDLIIWRR